MHTPIENELESFLAEGPVSQTFRDHLVGCGECREEVGLFQHQVSLIRSLRVSPVEVESESVAPVGGFYARLMERIHEMEGQSQASSGPSFCNPLASAWLLPRWRCLWC